MKPQTILKSLVLVVVLLASALVSYSSGAAATGLRVSLASPLCPSEMKSERIELASNGFQVGNA